MQHNHTHIPTTNKNIDQMVGDDDSSVASSRESFHRSDLDSSSDDDPDTHAGHTTTLPPPTSQQVQDWYMVLCVCTHVAIVIFPFF